MVMMIIEAEQFHKRYIDQERWESRAERPIYTGLFDADMTIRDVAHETTVGQIVNIIYVCFPLLKLDY